METLFDILDYSVSALYLIVFVIALFKYPLYKNTALKFLPVVLLITIIAEYLGMYIKVYFGPFNPPVYNIYYLFYFSLLFYIFLKEIKEEKFKKLIKIGIAVFWLFYISDWFITDFMNRAFIISYFVGAGVLIFCITLYYISILQSSLVLVVKNDLLFWVSVGLFLFFIGYIPIKIIRTWFYKEDSFFELLLIIQFSLIVIMYLFFLTGFLWMKKRS